jgi:hypothetical protein
LVLLWKVALNLTTKTPRHKGTELSFSPTTKVQERKKRVLCTSVVSTLPGGSVVLTRLLAVNGGVDAAERGNTVILDQLFAGDRVGTEFLGEVVVDTKGKTHDIGLNLMLFNNESLFQTGFQLEDFIIGMASQLIR